MDNTPEIILKRIIRVIVALIPVLGSPIENLTFGLYDDLENDKLLKKISEIEGNIKSLYEKGLETEEIINKIKESEWFKNTISLVEAQKTDSLVLYNNNVWKDKIFAYKFKDIRQKNINNLNDTSRKIGEIQNDKADLYGNINLILEELENIKKTLLQNTLQIELLPSQLSKYLVLKEMVKNCGIALKSIPKKNDKILLSAMNISDYSIFPNGDLRKEHIMIEYIISKKIFTYRLLELEMIELEEFIYYIRRNRTIPYIPNFNSIAGKKIKLRLSGFMKNLDEKSYIDETIPESEIQVAHNISMKNIVDKSPHFEISPRVWNIKYRDCKRLLKIIRLNQNTNIRTPIWTNFHTTYYKTFAGEEKYNQYISKLSIDIIALSTFFKNKKDNHKLLLTCHKVYKTIDNSIKHKYLEFKDDESLKDFLDNLETIKLMITEYKNDLKETALDPLIDLEKQQNILNKAFDEFYQSYSQLNVSLRNSLLNNDFFDFS